MKNFFRYFKIKSTMYDIIGDIHGHAEALKALLLKMDKPWKL